MKEKPILFSSPMVRAILGGRKTVTRRVISGVPMFSAEHDAMWRPHACPPGGAIPDEWSWWEGPFHGPSLYHKQKIPYRAGNRLWVREAMDLGADPVCYVADKVPVETDGGEQDLWMDRYKRNHCPGIHMPRWASRITLEVTGVKVERLQDISAADSVAEGVECETCAAMQASACGGNGCFASLAAFRDLWNSINGPGSWDHNPWVVAISFERVTP